MTFSETYRTYIRKAYKGTEFGYDLKTIAKLEPILSFLYKNWWQVKLKGLERLPHTGPALIVGNTGGILPWAAIMLLYALMSHKTSPRRLNILCDMSWIENERVHQLAREMGFVTWSAANAKRLFAEGELVIVFPEGIQGAIKPYSERYRLREFDWTQMLPAIEENIPIFPMSTIGCDESFPVVGNIDKIAKMLEVPAFPVTPFMPLLPFPLNLTALPGNWEMHLLRKHDYHQGTTRNENYETALTVSKGLEGEVQAELNRMLRARKSLF